MLLGRRVDRVRNAAASKSSAVVVPAEKYVDLIRVGGFETNGSIVATCAAAASHVNDDAIARRQRRLARPFLRCRCC